MAVSSLIELFRKAATRALTEWEPGQWDRQREDVDDLTNDLWVWYAERPETQRKFGEMQPWQVQKSAYKAALQILAGQALDMDKFKGRSLYSSEAVRSALLGQSTNRYLLSILPYALSRLDQRNPGQREAIRSRYEDKVVPPRGSAGEAVLRRAVKSLSDELNVIYLSSEGDCVGSRAATFPESRKRVGVHSDPTGSIAMHLLEHPELRAAYFAESPLEQVIGAALPAYQVTGNTMIRPDGLVAEKLKAHPEFVETFVECVRERLR